jgi:hypothetical protein
MLSEQSERHFDASALVPPARFQKVKQRPDKVGHDETAVSTGT